MRWRQQYDIPNCGVIAVAVIADCSIKKAIEVIGKNGNTKTKDLARGLEKLGYECPERLQRLKERPKLAIAKLSIPNTHRWHWVVIGGDKIYDGVHGNKKGEVSFPEGYRITSYLPITKKLTKSR